MAKTGIRRDSKHRVLRRGESIRWDGKYQFKYHVNGKAHFVYFREIAKGVLFLSGICRRDLILKDMGRYLCANNMVFCVKVFQI